MFWTNVHYAESVGTQGIRRIFHNVRKIPIPFYFDDYIPKSYKVMFDKEFLVFLITVRMAGLLLTRKGNMI